MKFLIIFIYLIISSYSYSSEKPDIKNMVLSTNPKIYKDVIFKDLNQKDVNLIDYKGKILILNFWATWCKPCREEMPSLDLLVSNTDLNNVVVFPINVGQEDLIKSKNFLKELEIKNLKIYYDPSINLAKKFTLRGIPTTILFNKDGKEFARIIGSIDFENEKFINWLGKLN